MKSAKKILLLVLSLVLLVGVFAVAAFADDSATATVVYPDGTVDTYTEAGAITPSIAAQDGLYYGKGNTLYKDAGQGWIYTDEAGQPVTEITEDLINAGAKITASGFDKVYATVDITIAEGDYVICLSDTEYVMAGTTTVSVAAYNSTDQKYYEASTRELDEAVRKIPVGTHKLYLTEAAAVHNFLNHATCSFEIGGVTYNYQDIRSIRANSAKITLYEDNAISTIGWDRSGGADRPATTINGAVTRAGSSYPASVLLDLNGYNLTNTKTSYVDVMGMVLYVYSSKAGAHYDASASAGSMFRTNDDAAIVLGDDNNAETDYSDNIYFHCKAINEFLYGTGIAINGGHFYQSAASANGMFNVSRRVGLNKINLPELQYTIENASFYLLPGSNAVLNNGSPSGAGVTIKNCAFYTSDAASLVYTAAYAKNALTVTADGCSFYGVAQDCIKADEATPVTMNITNDAAVEKKITYNTVTWADGTTEYYYATSLEKAKAFVESHSKATDPAPFAKEVDGEMFAMLNPVAVYAYDAAFNAVQTADGELAKVYYAYTTGSVTTFETEDPTKLDDLLKALPVSGETTITLYSNITIPGTAVNGEKDLKYYLDVNGYTLTISSTEGEGHAAIEAHATYFYLYSSRAGGVIDASAAKTFIHTDNTTYNGKSISSTSYVGGNNAAYDGKLTVICKQITGTMHGSALYIRGTTFVQSNNSSASYFLVMGRESENTSHVQDVKNCTFVLSNPITAPLYLRCSSPRIFEKCTFVAANANGGVALTAYTDLASSANTFTFTDCNFVNVQPYLGSAYVAYDNAAYGTTGIYTAADVDISDAEQVIAHGTTPKEITVLEKTYVLDGVLTTADKALKLSWGETGTEYWVIGSKPAREVANITKREGGLLLSNPAFDLIALDAIDENGIVTAAGEETVAIVFNSSEPLAFLYVDTKTGIENFVLVSEAGDAVGIGNKFYEIFNAPISSYVITLYADMTISRGMGFGTTTTSTNSDGTVAVNYNSLANGDITLDLNGKTLAIAEDFTAAIDPSNADSYDNALVDAIFAFEASAHKTFTIKSSAAGAKIINPTTHPLIAVGEQDRANIVIEGDYLEVVSGGTILLHVEPGSGSLVSVIGGKYTYTGKYVAFSASNSPIFKDFILELTNPNVAAAFASPNYSHETVYTIENVDVYATAGRPDLYGFTTHNTLVITNSPARTNGFTLNITDCELINVNLTKTYARTTVNFAGSLIASTMADLLAAIPTAPEGKTAAFYNATYGDKEYKVCCYTSVETATVAWGFGITETWVVGSVAMHEDAVIDNVFTYSFENLDVTGGIHTATATLVSIEAGVVRMNLTLQSKISMNLLLAEACYGATVTVNGETFVLSDMEAVEGYYVLTVAIAPDVADDAIPVTVSVNGHVHNLTTGIGNYAMAVLASEDAAVVPAKKLTYAMIEYVRAMNGNPDFCKDAVIPDGYDNNSPALTPSENEGTLLSGIAFRLNNTIAIAVQSAKDGETFVAVGKEVVLTLATGRIERETVGENGIVIFEDLYVNDFFGEMTIEVDGETYTYSLENYAFSMDETESAIVIALYNYAYYADDYVRNVVLAQAN